MVACGERRIDIGSALERIDRRNTLEFNSFIGVSYIQDLSVCDDLIDYFETHPEYRFVGTSGSLSKVNENVKKSTEISFLNVDPNLKERYFMQLKNVTEEYKTHYTHCNESIPSWGLCEEPKLQKYKPGEGFYRWHSERSSVLPYTKRLLVYMTYLNDVSDGGETEFFYQQVKLRPKKGLTLIWPADWTHTHRGVTSSTQTKYIVTGWYGFI